MLIRPNGALVRYSNDSELRIDFSRMKTERIILKNLAEIWMVIGPSMVSSVRGSLKPHYYKYYNCINIANELAKI